MSDILDHRGKPFAPMLAPHKQLAPDQITYPVMVSPKFDGIRCTIRNGRALTRKLLDVPNDFVREELGDAAEGLDGELMSAGGFNSVQSAIMSKHGEPDFVFNVFDWAGLGHEHGYAARYDFLQNEMPGHPRIELVEHTAVYDVDQLLEIEARYLAEGLEGVMVRSLDGPYKHGRATLKEHTLLKVKRFQDTEALVIGYKQLMHNTNEATEDELGASKRSHAKAGMVPMEALGSLRCLTLPHHVEFSIGSGFTPKQRENFWLIRDTLEGRLVKYKHQPAPVGGEVSGAAPRLPIFLGFRDRRDT